MCGDVTGVEISMLNELHSHDKMVKLLHSYRSFLNCEDLHHSENTK